MPDFSQYPAVAALATVDGYRTLTNGWDGADSLAPSLTHIELSIDLFKAWPADLPMPTAMVSSDGTLGMYWSMDHLYVDAEYDEDGRISVFARRRPDGHEHYQAQLSPEDGMNTLMHVLRNGI